MRVSLIRIRHSDPPVNHDHTSEPFERRTPVTQAWYAQNPETKVGSSGRTRIAAARRVRRLEREFGLPATSLGDDRA
jgi:hypothetical protein